MKGVLHGPVSWALEESALDAIKARVPVPAFDRSTLTPAIVHLGVGGFHRAHQAVYLDDLAALGNRAWGEIGVGLRSPVMAAALHPQDSLFTVVERDDSGVSARVIGAMTGYLYGPAAPNAVLKALADDRTRMVTLTITGDGYELDDAGALRADGTARADLDRPGAPRTMHGYLVEALRRRRAAGLPAFTVVSCDNAPDNGAVARAAVVGYATLRDPDLARWIEQNASFPSSLVDRITPGSSDELRRLLTDRFGVRDRSPVLAERFRQWVIEDEFCNGRPPLEDVGVQFVSDVAPYAVMKKRLLNGAHCALGYLGQLAGHHTVSDAMASPVIADYIAALIDREIAPLLPAVPGVDLADYRATVLQRLHNTEITDELSRLCRRGTTKMPAYLLPSLADARRRGRPAALLTVAVAAWIRYLRGEAMDRTPIDVVDPHRDLLRQRALLGGTDPRPLLRVRCVFGALGDDEGLVTALESALRDLESYGVEGSLRRQLAAEDDDPSMPAPRRRAHRRSRHHAGHLASPQGESAVMSA